MQESRFKQSEIPVTITCGEEGMKTSAWQLLTEFSLPGDSEDDGRLAGTVAEAVQRLALSASCSEQLSATLVEAVHATVQRSGPLSLIVMRVFVLKNSPEELAQGATTEKPGKEGAVPQSVGDDSCCPIRRGGYFSIDRLLDSSGGPDAPPSRVIELYLYREGASQ